MYEEVGRGEFTRLFTKCEIVKQTLYGTEDTLYNNYISPPPHNNAVARDISAALCSSRPYYGTLCGQSMYHCSQKLLVALGFTVEVIEIL